MKQAKLKCQLKGNKIFKMFQTKGNSNYKQTQPFNQINEKSTSTFVASIPVFSGGCFHSNIHALQKAKFSPNFCVANSSQINCENLRLFYKDDKIYQYYNNECW